MNWLDEIYDNDDENRSRMNHPTGRGSRKLSNRNHEKLPVYDWQLDPDMNDDFKSWKKQMGW